MTDDDPEKRPAENWSADGDGGDDESPAAEQTASSSADQSESSPTAEQPDSRSNDPNSTDEVTDPMVSDTQPDFIDAVRLRQLLEYALLATFVLVALFAALSFYSQVGRAIEIWVADAYQPIAKATVNLALLLIAVAGVSHQLARLAGRGSESDAGDE